MTTTQIDQTVVASVCVVYPFPVRLPKNIEWHDFKQDAFFTRIIPRPSAGGQSKYAAADTLAQDFESVSTVFPIATQPRRYQLHHPVELEIPGSSIAKIDFFITCFTDKNAAQLLMNISLSTCEVNDLIAIVHSASGRVTHETSNRDILQIRISRELTTPVTGSFRCAPTERSLRCLAGQIILAFADHYLKPAYRQIEFDKLEKRIREDPGKYLLSKLRCVELKRSIAGFDLVSASSAKNLIAHSNANAAYGLLAGDEGWPFVPNAHAVKCLENGWRSRDFFYTACLGGSILLINLPSPQYRNLQKDYWFKYFGKTDHYYGLSSSIAGQEHGPLRALEHVGLVQSILWDCEDEICDLAALVQRDIFQRWFKDNSALRQNWHKSYKVLLGIQNHLAREADDVLRAPNPEIHKLDSLLREQLEIDAEISKVQFTITEATRQLSARMESQRNNFILFISLLGLISIFIGLIGLSIEVAHDNPQSAGECIKKLVEWAWIPTWVAIGGVICVFLTIAGIRIVSTMVRSRPSLKI